MILYREDILGDKAFIEEMKADILRRAEAISDDDEDEMNDSYGQSANTDNKGKIKVIEIFDDDDAGLVKNVRIVGGEESDVDSDEEDEEEQTKSPEMILELAYLRDPKVFERDAVTRRSKARTNLKTQTGIVDFLYQPQSRHLTKQLLGWDDGQIEGWRVMLERNVSDDPVSLIKQDLILFLLRIYYFQPAQKEKMLQKHAFSGNEKGLEVPSGVSKGRGRGSPGGRGRGARGGAGIGGDAAGERVWKDKNKASRGNHNRKRGHDKKMARAGPGPSI